MSTRFTWHNAAKERQTVAHQRDRRQHIGFRRFHATDPQLFVVLPLAQGQLKCRFKALLDR
ncbi:hypothetical protein D3C75_1189150 [compost metagenome]